MSHTSYEKRKFRLRLLSGDTVRNRLSAFKRAFVEAALRFDASELPIGEIEVRLPVFAAMLVSAFTVEDADFVFNAEELVNVSGGVVRGLRWSAMLWVLLRL